MANYILSIFKTQLMVVWSWGFHQPISLENGLQFRVQGRLFKGIVRIEYNEGLDLFDVSFIKSGKIIEAIEGVYLDTLVNTIDYYVETPNS